MARPNNLYLEFVTGHPGRKQICGLCTGTGIVIVAESDDARRPCICPLGRAFKKAKEGRPGAYAKAMALARSAGTGVPDPTHPVDPKDRNR